MAKGIHKLLSVFQTEGLRGTLDRIKKLVLSWLGLRVFQTLFFRFSFDSATEMEDMRIHPSLQGLKFQMLTSLDELSNIHSFPSKMNFLPIEEWFSRGALCYSLIYDLRMIAYGWLHPKQYNIDKIGTFFPKEQEVFFGPALTERDFRRKGLLNLLLLGRLRYCKKNQIKHVYSACSIENTPSIKGLVRSGFKVVGCVRAKSEKNIEILEFNRGNLISQRLR